MGRLIFVGDRHQAIYGFRGADCRAMDNIIQRTRATIMPLSVSYRCAKAVIAEAQKVVVDIEPCDSAADGKVSEIKESALIKEAQCGDFILCRVSAPLASKCFALIKAGKKATIKGRDIGQNLLNLLDDMIKKSDNIEITTIMNTIFVETSKLVHTLQERHKDAEAISLQDRSDTLLVFLENASTVQDAKDKIASMFSDNNGAGVVLSTIHKAKGLEANKVFILQPELLPHPMAKSEWQQEQEMNLKYVAITRAKVELVWVITEKTK